MIRSIDWSATPLGPVERWPAGLKNALGMLLHTAQPMFLFWGPQLIQFYNDAYTPILGRGKHPAAMGKPAHMFWQESWSIIAPQVADVFSNMQATRHENALAPFWRNGRIEEAYFTYGYAPVFGDEDKVGGAVAFLAETTAHVLAERRRRTLRTFDQRSELAATTGEVRDATVAAFDHARADLPFMVLYGDDAGPARPTYALGVGLDTVLRAMNPRVADALSAARVTPARVTIDPVAIAHDTTPEPVTEVFVVPLKRTASGSPRGFVVTGLSPRLPFDAGYRQYLLQLGEHLDLAYARLEIARSRAAAISERNNLLLQAPIATAFISGPDHLFELANRTFIDMVDRPDLVGKTLAHAFPELVGTPLETLLNGVYKTGHPFQSQELSVPLARYGRAVEDAYFRISLEPLRDPLGEVYGMIAVGLEVTEQVESRQVLERAYDERAKLLDELESASRAKDEFLAMLGHELRNPLSPIVTALQLMRMRGDSKTTKEQLVIERQVKHLIRLVDDLLDVSRIARGKVELRKERGEISDVAAKAVEMASVLFEQRAQQLSIDVPKQGLPWEGDPVRLAQALSNLLTNSARYTDVGGHIWLKAWREGSEIVMSVRDDGIGIPADMLPRIFDLFVQGKRNADRAEGGLGLGLALTKNLVLLHGGSVHASSAGVGKGSEFTIRLPVATSAEAGADARAGTAAGPRPHADGKRILLVDDNHDAADLLAEVLRAAGHRVTVANDPWTALNLATEQMPEVAVLDIGLPVMDGYELAARMHAMPGLADCKLIALTGYGREHDRRRSSEAGFAQHLVKPVDLDKLLHLVDA